VVHAQHVDVGVARVAVQIVGVARDFAAAGRERKQQILQPVLVAEIVDGKAPQRDEVGVTRVRSPPPEPAAGMLVERTKDDRDQLVRVSA
jgi:hypothetical protein